MRNWGSYGLTACLSKVLLWLNKLSGISQLKYESKTETVLSLEEAAPSDCYNLFLPISGLLVRKLFRVAIRCRFTYMFREIDFNYHMKISSAFSVMGAFPWRSQCLYCTLQCKNTVWCSYVIPSLYGNIQPECTKNVWTRVREKIMESLCSYH